MKFTIKSLTTFITEAVHNVPASRQVLVNSNDISNLDAVTRAYLKTGQCWDWHKHDAIDEIGIVLKGKGVMGYRGKEFHYKKDDVIYIPTSSTHKWQATTDSEFIFIRVKR